MAANFAKLPELFARPFQSIGNDRGAFWIIVLLETARLSHTKHTHRRVAASYPRLSRRTAVSPRPASAVAR
jgi:hypothetical protein